MLRNLRLVAGSMLFASVAMLVAQGAELRTTAARRPIHRTVSFQEASFEEAAEYTEMIDSVVQSDVLVESCPSCGVAGCDMGCVIPCDRWVSFEYLLWWRKGQNFPALITTSPTGTAQADAGVLLSATVLFGNETTGEADQEAVSHWVRG